MRSDPSGGQLSGENGGGGRAAGLGEDRESSEIMPREHSRWVAVAQTFCAGRSPSLRPRSGFLQGPRDGFDDGEEDAAADAAADDLPHDRAEIKTAGGGPGRLGHSRSEERRGGKGGGRTCRSRGGR